MIVLKFGGTSVENAAAMSTVVRIVQREQHRQPVVILSAIAGATNALIKAAQLAQEGNHEQAIRLLNDLLERHVVILENLLESRSAIQRLILEIRRRFDELKLLCQGITLLGELTNRSLDAIASVGERLSTQILADAMTERGMPVKLVDARSFMITDDHYTSAAPQFGDIQSRIDLNLRPSLQSGKIILTQGFIGATSKGTTTTLGRGGSDYSAAIVGAALDAEEIQIWTDVDGILTADPRICPDARKLKVISFREASELAYFGAKVLHPSTILPAVQKNIPVSVMNSRKPDATGTLIVSNPPKSNLPVKSIASKKGITVINIQSTRMLMAYGFLEKIFAVFDKFKTPVDLVTTSEVAVSLTIDNSTCLTEIVADLSLVGDVLVYERKGIVCIVGEQMQSTAGIADRVFRALQTTNVMMISQGASEINMSLVLNEEDIERAVKNLHGEFFPLSQGGEIFESLHHEAGT